MSYCSKESCQCKTCTLNSRFCSCCKECIEHKILRPVEKCNKIYDNNIKNDELEEKIRELIKKSGNEEQVCLLYERGKIEYRLNKTEFSDSYGKIYSMVMDYMFQR